jgi:hypothetical protein
MKVDFPAPVMPITAMMVSSGLHRASVQFHSLVLEAQPIYLIRSDMSGSMLDIYYDGSRPGRLSFI